MNNPQRDLLILIAEYLYGGSITGLADNPKVRELLDQVRSERLTANRANFTIEVQDAYSATPGATHTVTIQNEGAGLSIGIDGYGDKTSAPPHGRPILLEFRDGTPTLVVWADITQEDPTHVIDLSGAKEPA